MSTQGMKLGAVVKTEAAPAPAPANTFTSAREIKREPVVFKTETAPGPVPVNSSIDQAEAEAPIIHTEPTPTYGDQRSAPESYSHSASESCIAHRFLASCAAAAKHRSTVAAVAKETLYNHGYV
jgi:hypothetical protein